MIVRALDANGDWTFGKGRNDYKSGKKALEQNIQTRLKSFLGDCFFDATAGIDWFNLLGGKSIPAINIAVAACLTNTLNVTGINQVSSVLDPVTRLLTISYNVQTTYGPVNNVYQYDLNGVTST